MPLKRILLTGLWGIGLAAWIFASHDLLLLPGITTPRPGGAAATAPAARSFIVQGDDVRAVARAVERVGGTITHRLSIIDAVGAELGPEQRRALEGLDAVRRIHADRSAHVAARGDRGTGPREPEPTSVPYSEFPSLAGIDMAHYQGLTGAGVAVAVLDTGLWEAEELVHDTTGGRRPVAGYDAIRDKSRLQGDDNGHGTHVASIIFSSAAPDGRPGLYNGAAPDAGVVAVRAFDENGQGSYLDIIRGLGWILLHKEALGIRVLNLSFSAPPQSYYWDDPLNQAVMAVWEAGIVVVTSAGNTGPEAMTIGVPGNVPYVITVGAMTDAFTPDDPSDDRLSIYSAAGPTVEGFVKPDLIAPGGHVMGRVSASSLLAEQYPEWFDGEYFVMSGTSQAAAVVSGAVALMLEADPWLTPDEVKCRLIDSARPAVDASGELAYSPLQQGAGLVHAADAVASSALACANQGLDVTADLDGVEHFSGPVQWSDEQGFYVGGTSYSWDGAYRSATGFTWTDASPWIQASPWINHATWTDSAALIDATPWINQLAGIDATPWINDRTLWTGDEKMAINVWIGQD